MLSRTSSRVRLPTGSPSKHFAQSLAQTEPTIRQWVVPQLLRQWLGGDLFTDSLPAPGPPGAPVPREHLGPIVARSEAFVALTTGTGTLVQMVDRCALASRLAVEALMQSY